MHAPNALTDLSTDPKVARQQIISDFTAQRDSLIALKPFMGSGWLLQMPNSLLVLGVCDGQASVCAVEDATLFTSKGQAKRIASQTHDGTGATAEAVTPDEAIDRITARLNQLIEALEAVK